MLHFYRSNMPANWKLLAGSTYKLFCYQRDVVLILNIFKYKKAMNYQTTTDSNMHLHNAFFAGTNGYVLRPSVAWNPTHVLYQVCSFEWSPNMSRNPNDIDFALQRFIPSSKSQDGLHPTTVTLTIVSGQYVCRENYLASPIVEIEVTKLAKFFETNGDHWILNFHWEWFVSIVNFSLKILGRSEKFSVKFSSLTIFILFKINILNNLVYWILKVIGLPRDCSKYKTKMVARNALNPIWEETFELEISLPQLAFIRFNVIEGTSNVVTAQRVVPVNRLRSGS